MNLTLHHSGRCHAMSIWAVASMAPESLREEYEPFGGKVKFIVKWYKIAELMVVGGTPFMRTRTEAGRKNSQKPSLFRR